MHIDNSSGCSSMNTKTIVTDFKVEIALGYYNAKLINFIVEQKRLWLRVLVIKKRYLY